MRKTRTTKTRAVAYLRVSTDKQADHGVSLDVQRRKVEQYAALFDIDLVSIEVDAGASAKSLDRPALGRTLAMLRKGTANALLVVKLDRLTRSVRDLCDLVDDFFRGDDCALLSVDEQLDTRSAMGRAVLKIFTTLGEMEREQIGERTSAAMRHLVDQGRFTGGTSAPYGFSISDDGESLAPRPAEQSVIVEARSLHAEGKSLRSIARALDSRGHRSRTGRPFVAVQVARMLSTRRTVEVAA